MFYLKIKQKMWCQCRRKFRRKPSTVLSELGDRMSERRLRPAPAVSVYDTRV